MNENIGIFIYYPKAFGPQEAIREIGFGIEEEGIPFMAVEADSEDFHRLAERASAHSQLEVGIGLDIEGRFCLHQAKLPDGFYLFESSLSDKRTDLRSFGANSARLVKGMPFKAIVTL